MVTMIRFNSFVTFLILFLFYSLRSSIAQPHQGAIGKMALVVDNNMHHTWKRIVKKESWNDVQAMVEERLTKLGGRKMILKRVLEQKMVNENGSNGDSLRVSENSSATSSEKRSIHPAGVPPNDGVYIPLDADYHIPRPHPPKNN